MQLGNCSTCGEVFAKGLREVCPACFKKEEEAFELVYRFLMKRKNRQATLDEVVEETGVEKDLIIKFIKQNRIRTSQFPSLGYPCDICGTEIIEGKLCESCSKSIKDDMAFIDQIEKIKKDRKESETSVYYTMKKDEKN